MITEAQEQAGLNAEDNAVLYLLLAIFGLGVVNMALMQSAVNKIWEQDIIEMGLCLFKNFFWHSLPGMWNDEGIFEFD